MDVQVLIDLTWLTGCEAEWILLHYKDVLGKWTHCKQKHSLCVKFHCNSSLREAATEII